MGKSLLIVVVGCFFVLFRVCMVATLLFRLAVKMRNKQSATFLFRPTKKNTVTVNATTATTQGMHLSLFYLYIHTEKQGQQQPQSH